MLDETQFRVRFPEFRGAPSALIQAKLADASKRIAVGLLGTSADEAHGWKTAHLLATSPWGMAARLDPKSTMKADTVYSAGFQEMANDFGVGWGVL